MNRCTDRFDLFQFFQAKNLNQQTIQRNQIVNTNINRNQLTISHPIKTFIQSHRMNSTATKLTMKPSIWPILTCRSCVLPKKTSRRCHRSHQTCQNTFKISCWHNCHRRRHENYLELCRCRQQHQRPRRMCTSAV